MAQRTISQHRRIRAVVFGAGGRMGTAVLDALTRDARFELAAAVLRAGDERLGLPVPAFAQHRYRDDSQDTDANIAIDFTGAAQFDGVLARCVDRSWPLVSGTTGLSPAQQRALNSAASHIPILWASNFSIGVALLQRLATLAAVALPDFDCSILETHRRGKVDAPSGTALAMGEAIGKARDPGRGSNCATTANRNDASATATISYHSMRLGDTVGEHVVTFAGPSERVELVHRALDRAVFAGGAMRAAAWLAWRAPGRYVMHDLLDSVHGSEPV